MKLIENIILTLKYLIGLYKYDLIVFDKRIGYMYGVYNRKINRIEVMANSLEELYILAELKLGICKLDINHQSLHDN